jgi:hypothetical protein
MNSNGGNQSAVKYSKDFEVPADFPEILRNLTREILRENPTNIEKFGMYSITILSWSTTTLTSFSFQYLYIRLLNLISQLFYYSIAQDYFAKQMALKNGEESWYIQDLYRANLLIAVMNLKSITLITMPRSKELIVWNWSAKVLWQYIVLILVDIVQMWFHLEDYGWSDVLVSLYRYFHD